MGEQQEEESTDALTHHNIHQVNKAFLIGHVSSQAEFMESHSLDDLPNSASVILGSGSTSGGMYYVQQQYQSMMRGKTCTCSACRKRLVILEAAVKGACASDH